MDESLSLSDSDKPRYLLPEGCKDLYDVIRLQEKDAAQQKQMRVVSELLEKYASTAMGSKKPLEDLSAALKKHWNETSAELPLSVKLPDPVTVGELAERLHLKTFKLISVLVDFKIFASADSSLTFAVASQVCAHLGVAAQRAEAS